MWIYYKMKQSFCVVNINRILMTGPMWIQNNSLQLTQGKVMRSMFAFAMRTCSRNNCFQTLFQRVQKFV